MILLNLITGVDKKKLILIFLIAAVVFYVDIAYIMKFQFDGIASMEPKIVKIQKDIDTFKRDAANVEALKKLPPQQLSGPLKNKKFVNPEQMSLLIETISDIANKNNVKIMQISAAPESKAKETAKPKNQKPGNEADIQSYILTMELLTDYHHFGSFLSDLDYSSVICSVQEFRITGNTDSYDKEDIKLLLKTYVKK